MKLFSIVAIALCALVLVCSSAPVVDEQPALEAQLRLDIYEDLLQGLFSGIVQTTLGSLSNFLLQAIQTNPLGIGKRNAEEDLQARVDVLTFLYENILQQFFGGLVTNTFQSLSGVLNNLITTNPLGIGKRNAEEDLQARVDALTFLYENILQQFFGGLVTNTFESLAGVLNNLITTNPLGIGKRDARISIWSFLYDNIVADFLTGLVSNSANLVQDTLLNLIQTNPLNIGKRSVNFQQIETIVKQAISTLVQHFNTFAHQAVNVWTDKQQLAALVKGAIADFQALIGNFAQQLSTLIPTTIAGQVDKLLNSLQSMLIFWTSGLGGSLGPVIGPFPH